MNHGKSSLTFSGALTLLGHVVLRPPLRGVTPLPSPGHRASPASTRCRRLVVLRGRDPAGRHPQARRLGRGRRNRGLNNSAEAPGGWVRRHGDARRGRARPGEPRPAAGSGSLTSWRTWTASGRGPRRRTTPSSQRCAPPRFTNPGASIKTSQGASAFA